MDGTNRIMITLKTYYYSFGTLHHMIADDGDLMQWKDDATCTFAYVVSGDLRIIDSPVPEAINYSYVNSKGLDPVVFVAENKYQAFGRTEWICAHFSFKRPSGFSSQLLHLNGTSTLPSGWGFFVVSGSATVSGITAIEDNYFKPRNEDLEISGDGTLILIQ
jgi:hypothetical protein